jgi:tRNA-dihydrouridine synthase 1
MDDLPLVERMVSHLAAHLAVPVTVKIRRFECVQRTVEYAQMLERAGASLLAIHGRTREQKRASEVRAEWEHIRAVKQVSKQCRAIVLLFASLPSQMC